MRFRILLILFAFFATPSRGQDLAFYRLHATGQTAIVDIQVDGSVTWTNASTLEDVQFQRARPTNWQDYVRIPATGAVQTARLFDLFPPAGMVLIPAGSFVMGATTNMGHESYSDDTPQHTVNVSAFYMDQYEVTKALWDEVANWASSHGYDITADGGNGKAANHPVQMVSWYECVKWCNARSQLDGLTACYSTAGNTYKTGNNSNVVCNWTANGYRLPTEAEWEKAARGGAANHRFPWSDSDEIQHARANYYSTSNYAYDSSPTRGYHPAYTNAPIPYTSPVGTFYENGYGLYDMAGNVWEWCWDHDDSQTAHRIRGGMHFESGEKNASRLRISRSPDSRLGVLGFRLARNA